MTENELQKKYDLSNETMKQLNRYYELVIEENKIHNLTRIIKKEDFYLKHFDDSLSLIKYIDFQKKIYVCDFGTGAGFPGMVLKIVYPKLKIDLLDSNNKKTRFLKKTTKELNLTNINIIASRVEEHNIQYDYVICRAVAKIGILCEISSNIIKKNGYLVCMKSKEEINNEKEALKVGLIFEKKEEYNLKSNERSLFFFKKISEPKLSRNYSQIIKQPLF